MKPLIRIPGLVYEPVCYGCVHYIIGNRCVAFPAGIPAAVLRGEDQHTSALPGDGGLRYKKRT